jgi:methionyl-tRNA formyltransferase
LRTLEDLEAGRALSREQDHAQASPAPKLTKEDGAIDWNLPAAAIHNRVRAFNPYPACYATEMLPSGPGRVLRVHRSRPAPAHGGAPGELRAEGGEPFVGTGEGALQLLEVQWEGKPRISGRDLVNGLRGTPLRFFTEGAT